MPLPLFAAPYALDFFQEDMHDIPGTIAQFKPLMHPELAHFFVLVTAARARLDCAGESFIRRQYLLTGALMIGPGLFGGGWSAFFGCLLLAGGTGLFLLLLGRPERTVLGRRLVGIGGIAVQAFAQGEIFLLESNVFLLEGDDFLPLLVHQFGQTLVFGKADLKNFLKRLRNPGRLRECMSVRSFHGAFIANFLRMIQGNRHEIPGKCHEASRLPRERVRFRYETAEPVAELNHIFCSAMSY